MSALLVSLMVLGINVLIVVVYLFDLMWEKYGIDLNLSSVEGMLIPLQWVAWGTLHRGDEHERYLFLRLPSYSYEECWWDFNRIHEFRWMQRCLVYSSYHGWHVIMTLPLGESR